MKGKGKGFPDNQGHWILILWDPDGTRRTVRRARLVMEAVLGRPLRPGEVVHHINSVPDDDRPENLWVCENQAEHVRIHAFTEHLVAQGLLDWSPADGGQNKMIGGRDEALHVDESVTAPGPHGGDEIGSEVTTKDGVSSPDG